MPVVLETRGLAKKYGALWALQGLDLDVRQGEVFGFLGPNGAGKTTFTKCVTGFVRPDRGEVRVAGEDAVRHPWRAASHVGLVPDQYDFYPNLTGRQHLEFYGRLMGMPQRRRRERIAEVLAQLRMEERADSKTKTYSHGMKQRICIAQAILHQPDLVIFDEPTNGLDPKGAYELRMMIRELASQGHTVFLNSHLLHEVQETCSRVAVLDRGRLLALETVETLRRRFSDGGAVELVVENPSAKLIQALQRSAGGTVTAQGNTLRVPIDEDRIPDMVAATVQAGGRVRSVTPATASLEDVFLRLTEEAGP